MNTIYKTLLAKIINDIIPHTKKAIKKGNKIFGAAILKKDDYSTLVVGTNNEIANPLFHGEISAINNFFNSDISKNINPKNCIFLSTHEPCSLCLSAISWSGFDNFYYFFPYNDTKKTFYIPHDLKILKEVFKINEGKYNKNNSFWNSYSIINEIKKLNIDEKNILMKDIEKIYDEYKKMSKIYQYSKKNNKIPLN